MTPTQEDLNWSVKWNDLRKKRLAAEKDEPIRASLGVRIRKRWAVPEALIALSTRHAEEYMQEARSGAWSGEAVDDDIRRHLSAKYPEEYRFVIEDIKQYWVDEIMLAHLEEANWATLQEWRRGRQSM